MLLTSFATVISLFSSATFATPIESPLSPHVPVKAPLLARQAGTYGGVDTNINASLAGTYSCYKGGTWVLQTELDIPIHNICGAPAWDSLEFQKFSFDPTAEGAYPNQESFYQLHAGCFVITPNCDPTPPKNQAYVKLTADIVSATHANMGDCEYALGRLQTLCHGDNGWTRGGYYTFIDGTTYGADPARNGGNGQ